MLVSEAVRVLGQSREEQPGMQWKNIGPKLAEIRKEAGYTGAELADRIQVSAGVVSRVEQKDSNPKWETILRYLDALDVSPGVLFAKLGEGDLASDQLSRIDELETKMERLEPLLGLLNRGD